MAALSSSLLRTIKRLYVHDALSAREIAARYKVSLDSVYYFFRHHHIPRRSASEHNAIRFFRKKPSFLIKKTLSKKEERLMLAALMLYWGEGYQASHGMTLDFANSNPAMIRVFVRCLRTVFRVDAQRLRCYLYCYSNQHISKLISFWSHISGIPKNQFTKPYVRDDFNPTKQGKMPYGLIHIRYSDKKLLLLFKQLIQSVSEELGT